MLTDAIEMLKNKVVSGVGAGGLVVSAEATKGGLIDITQHGWIFPWASWMQIIGVFKLIKYLFEKFRK